MQPILIYGAGAIGGTAGAHMVRAGLPVLFVDRNAAHVEAMNRRGLTIQGPGGAFTVTVSAALPEEIAGRVGAFREAFLCVKSQDTAAAAAEMAPLLAPDGYVVSLQNGLNEDEIDAAVGAGRTVAAFVNFSADLLEPGVIHYAGASKMAIGERDGTIGPRLRRVAWLLEPMQAVEVSANVDGYLWSKVAYGAMLFATAMTDATMAECVDHPRYRPVLLRLAGESCALARAQGIELYAFDGWDPGALDDPAAANAMMDALSAVMRRNTKVRSGVWRDLAVHHKRTEINEFVPLFALADRLDVPMPLTRLLVERIHDLEEGRAERGFDNLELLADAAGAGA